MDKNKNYFKKVDVFRSGKRVKFKEDIQGCRREMENVRIRDDRDTGVRYIKLQKIMETFMIQGDIFWLQKAKMFWYRERDKNTSYFHATVLVRKMRNRVKCLLCEDVELSHFP